MEYFNFFEYHETTKHSYYSVRNNPNRIDWNNPPNRFKIYPKEFQRIALDTKKINYKFLYFINGITAKKTYPNMEYYLRINPSAGALYPNEIYFQVRNEEGFEDGIYHLEVATSSIVLLKKLEKSEGIEANLGLDFICNGFIFFISSLYFRSSWKYKNRAFRYCLLDAGHLIGSIEQSAYLFDKNFEIKYDFPKLKLNELFNFDNKEFFTAVVICGTKNKTPKDNIYLNLPLIDGCSYEDYEIFFDRNEKIENAYKDSLNIFNTIKQNSNNKFIFNKEFLEDTIYKRRSIREFSKQFILKFQLETILNVLNQPITSDVDEKIDIYYVVNRVKDEQIGLYLNGNLIKNGDFASKAGYLCLEQELGKDSAVTFFLTTKSKNYQEAYQKAGILGHRLYIASNYLKIGCSGIGAYYDDEVCEFLGDYNMILYALAIGN